MKTIKWQIKRLSEICDLMCEVPVAAVLESVMGKGLTGIAKEFTSELLANKMSRLLELGCGDGRLTIPFAKKGFRITAVDLSQVALNRLMERARRYGVQNLIEVCKKDIFTAVPSEKYDAVVCADVFHYFEKSDVLPVLDHIKQATAQGGYNYLRIFADIRRTRDGRPLTYNGGAAFSSAEVDQILQRHYAAWDVIALKHTAYETRWPPLYLDSTSSWEHLSYHMEAVGVEVIARRLSHEIS